MNDQRGEYVDAHRSDRIRLLQTDPDRYFASEPRLTWERGRGDTPAAARQRRRRRA